MLTLLSLVGTPNNNTLRSPLSINGDKNFSNCSVPILQSVSTQMYGWGGVWVIIRVWGGGLIGSMKIHTSFHNVL